VPDITHQTWSHGRRYLLHGDWSAFQSEARYLVMEYADEASASDLRGRVQWRRLLGDCSKR